MPYASINSNLKRTENRQNTLHMRIAVTVDLGQVAKIVVKEKSHMSQARYKFTEKSNVEPFSLTIAARAL